MSMDPRFVPPTDLSPYSAFIFDCDGTLADTMPLHFKAWQAALSQGGASFHFTWELFVSRAGMSMEQTVVELSQQFSVTLNAQMIADHQRAIFLSMETTVKPIDEVLRFARRIAQKFPVAVASGSSRSSVERTLSQIGARELFDVLITPEDVQYGKPHPDMFLLAAQRLSVPPQRRLVLEDGELGFEAARRAQMDYCVVAPEHAERTAQPSI
jgi:HAD superfamily hydrolase (TIGR01509 family)